MHTHVSVLGSHPFRLSRLLSFPPHAGVQQQEKRERDRLHPCTPKMPSLTSNLISLTRDLYTHECYVLLLLLSHSVMSDSLQPHGLKHAKLALSFTISWSLLKLISIESMMPSNHLILCCPLLLLPSVFPNIRVFSSSLHQVAKVLEFQLQHQSFQ